MQAIQEPPLTYSLKAAAELLGVSEWTIGKLTREIDPISQQPKLKSVKLGRRKVVTRREIERFLGIAS